MTLPQRLSQKQAALSALISNIVGVLKDIAITPLDPSCGAFRMRTKHPACHQNRLDQPKVHELRSAPFASIAVPPSRWTTAGRAPHPQLAELLPPTSASLPASWASRIKMNVLNNIVEGSKGILIQQDKDM
ncbi:hypothetical protein PGTUg99_036183 [Puccinia graminis f. sp. tritici]|uniref:Uncharacterized protein n=1 Tax=Puccinia graminis f. sp. tritici TaxID=56615 RepID=A0A5B0RPV5_PUCGR|nr:hypothetical protein PGTUg99_036183 [Puccinia graminis f. sp. tritici]